MAARIIRFVRRRLSATPHCPDEIASAAAAGSTRADHEPRRIGRFGTLVVPIVIGVVVLVGLGRWTASHRLDQLAAVERDVVQAQVAAAQSALGRVSTDVCVLANENELQQYLATGDPAMLDLMAREYVGIATEVGNYDQIRFLDATGMERTRVQLEDGRPVVVAPANLQSKVQNAYFRETMRMAVGTLYVSPLDLNVEHGTIEVPHKPMLRLATPVADESGATAGIVVINVLAETILDAVRQAGTGEFSKPQMLNSAGYWLLDDDDHRSWAFMFQDAGRSRLGHVDPPAWAAMTADTSGSVRTGQGLYTFAWFTFTVAHQRCGGLKAAGPRVGRSWVMVSQVPEQTLVADERRTAGLVALTGLPLLVLGAMAIRAICEARLKRRQYRTKLERLARCDKLTGLANRAAFEEHLKTALEDGRQLDRRFALILVDLDHFKEVNDGLGHDAGDALLKAVATRLSGCVRNGDVVARMGGDEFAAILFGDVDRDVLEKVAERMLRAIQAPFAYAGREILPGGSIGVARFPVDGQRSAELFKSADLALYRAKRGGRRSIHFFDQGMRQEASARLDLATDIRASLEAGDFHVVFQPVVRLADGALHGFEALVRWQHPHRGPIAPTAFLPIAEDSGLAGEVGDVVLDRAVETMTTLWAEHGSGCTVTLNAGAAQLKDPAFGAHVLAKLRAHGIDPKRLQIDVTEHVLVDANQQIRSTLNALRAAGVAVALDDFGTGHAALAHLKELPLDILKIDRSVVAGIAANADNALITRAVVDLAHGLHLKVVAEGIETPAQLDALERLGCDFGQGYLIGRPAPAEAFRDWLRSRPAERTPAL